MPWRYKSTLLFFIFLFLIIFARLFYWQVVRAQELAEMGQYQYGRFIKQIPIRGEIMTSDGYPIAANKLTYLVFADPKDIAEDDKEKVTKLLAPLLQIDEASLSANLALNRQWVPLKSHVKNDVKQEIEKIKLEGIGFEEQKDRFYPEASMAAKLLGFVGKDDEGNNKGYFGLEGYYDRQLKGKTGLAKQIHDANNKPILAKMDDRTAKVDGRNIILHIDRTVQYILEDELKTGLEKFGALSTEGIIMEPKTGGILALASFPSFDPRSYQDYTSDLYLNPIISSSYEPGSTFKPLVMAAALDSNLIKPETPCGICGGPIEIGGYTINTWNNKYQEGISMIDVIRESDNTGMVFTAKLLGLDRMYSYLTSYGLGQITGIDLQGEVAPNLRPKEEWYPIDLATASFGQGISVTPIQLITAFNVLANDGKRMEPHVVSKIETSDGEMITINPKMLDQPISEKTVRIMREMLVNAVKKGEARFAAPKGYRIAGKTGTAQIPIAGHYDSSKTIASFIGYAPADDPKFLMLIIYNQPSSSIYGAETAAPTFFNIAKKLFAYYGISPTE